MITEYSIKTINLEKQELFAMPILYDLCLDNCKIKLHDIAIDCFIELIKVLKSSEIISNYLEKSITNIKNDDSVCQSMLIIQKIMTQATTFIPYRLKEDLFKKIDFWSEGIVRLLIISFNYCSAPEKKSAYSDAENIKIRIQF